MTTVSDIVSVASKLSSEEFLQLREELDRLEQSIWQAERARATADLKCASVTEDQIDQLIMRRRRESRS
jgi:hypothetical protein